MDKELAKLEEWAVNLINDYETVLRQKNPKSSFFKKANTYLYLTSTQEKIYKKNP